MAKSVSNLRYETQEAQAALLKFVVERMLVEVCTVTLVQVKAVSNAGAVAAVGTVNIQPMIHMIDASSEKLEHGVLKDVPYFRVQGGSDAIILDPKVGDIGLAAFCMRDISTVRKTKAPALPASLRMFDWTDGLYFGGFLNGVPSQYIAFASGGITMVSPTKVTIQAPNVQIDASTGVSINTPNVAMSQDSSVGGTLTATTDVVGGGKHLKTHTHPGVATGDGTSGQPT